MVTFGRKTKKENEIVNDEFNYKLQRYMSCRYLFSPFLLRIFFVIYSFI